jgi:hypothetical protein
LLEMPLPTDGGGDSSAGAGAALGDAAVCVTVVPDRAHSPAYLEIVLDGSESMIEENKWSAAVLALDAIFDDFAKKADPNTAIGLSIFSDLHDPTSGRGPYPSNLDVAPGYVDVAQHDALRARLDKTLAGGVTPTLEALKGAYDTLLAFTPSAPLRTGGRRVVVLMSDGVPNGGDEEQQQCIDLAIRRLTGSPPIWTFAIGIGPFLFGSDYDPTFMGQLAVAGGTRATPGCDPNATELKDICYFQITPLERSADAIAEDMVAALDTIRSLTDVTCAFDLRGDTNSLDPAQTIVTWTDEQGHDHTILRDPTNGWDYEDPQNPTRITLRGKACADATSRVDIVVHVKTACRR